MFVFMGILKKMINVRILGEGGRAVNQNGADLLTKFHICDA